VFVIRVCVACGMTLFAVATFATFAADATPPDVSALLEKFRPLIDEIQRTDAAGQSLDAARLQRRLVDDLVSLLGAGHPFVADALDSLEIYVGESLGPILADGNWTTALESLRLLSHLYPSPDRKNLVSRCWEELFLLRQCLNQGYLDSAADLLQSRQTVFAPLSPDDPLRLDWLILSAQLAEQQTDYAQAAATYAQVRDLSLSAPASAEDLNAAQELLQREALSGLTQVATMRGQWDPALELCHEWRSLAQSHGPDGVGSLAESWLSEGVVLRYSGRLAEAEVACRRALIQSTSALPPGADPTLEVANAFNELAIIQFALGEPEAAHQSGLEAWRIYASWLGPDSPVVARLEGNLAEIARRLPLDDRQPLEGFLDQALERATSADSAPPRVVATLRQTAGLYAELEQNWAAARENFAVALEIRREVVGERHHTTARAMHHLARSELALGAWEDAQQHLQTAADTLQQRFGETHVEAALTIADLGLAAEFRHDPETAVRQYRLALSRLAAGRARVGVRGLESLGLSEAAQVSTRLATLLASQGRVQAATAVWQESLGSSLREELAIRQLRSLAPQEFQALGELEDDYASLTARLERTSGDDPATETTAAAIREQRDGVQAQLVEQKRALLAAHPLLQTEAFNLAEIQAQLPPEAAFVGWVSREESLLGPTPAHWGVVVRRTGLPLWIPLPAEYQPDSATGLRDAIARQDFTPLLELATEVETLSRLVWSPLAAALGPRDELPVATHIIVMPSPGLQGVPIDVLAPPEAVVTYAPSATLWAWLRHRAANAPDPARGERLLALGDPNFEDPRQAARGLKHVRWAPLPGTRQEVASLAELCRRQQVAADVFLGSAASQQTVLGMVAREALASYRFLHFATHGEANPHVPLRSRLVLAQDGLPDPLTEQRAADRVVTGELTAEAVLRTWNLRADLVTLSACESALGRFTASEGYVGLSQAFLLAGSQSVVSSLWKVDDLATALLMVRFYENLLGARADLAQPLPKAAALQEAKTWLRHITAAQQQEMLDQSARGQPVSTRSAGGLTTPVVSDLPYAHPHYWAAFVLIGDGE